MLPRPCESCRGYDECSKGWYDALRERGYMAREGKDCWREKENTRKTIYADDLKLCVMESMSLRSHEKSEIIGLIDCQKDASTDNDAEWIISSDGYYPYCSKCYHIPDEMTNFCPECGSKMKGRERKW